MNKTREKVLARYTVKDLENPAVVQWLAWLHDLGL